MSEWGLLFSCVLWTSPTEGFSHAAATVIPPATVHLLRFVPRWVFRAFLDRCSCDTANIYGMNLCDMAKGVLSQVATCLPGAKRRLSLQPVPSTVLLWEGWEQPFSSLGAFFFPINDF